MRVFGALITALLFAFSPPIAARQNAPTTSSPLDLNALINAFKDPGLTALEKQALSGRRYSGVITIDAMGRDSGKGSVRLINRIYIDTPENELLHAGMLAFEINDAEKAASVKRGSKVRVTGRLDRTYVRSGREWTEFVDATIDEVITF